MSLEKEQQISPIVAESVIHNTKVSQQPNPPSLARLSTWPSASSSPANPPPPGPGRPSIPDRLPVRCRSRHPRPRVLQRFPLLHRLHPPDGPPLLRHPRRPGLPDRRQAGLRHEPLLSWIAGAVDEWILWRTGRVHPDVDAVLWVGESIEGYGPTISPEKGSIWSHFAESRRITTRFRHWDVQRAAMQ